MLNKKVPGFEIKQTKASMSGVKYASAIEEEILNMGEVVLTMITAEGTKRRMKLQAAQVSRPLASVKRICEAGHTVVFQFARTRQRTLLNPMGPQRESSTRSHGSGTGNEK